MSAAADIHRIVVYPAIGIARVGNSPDLFFFGPEAPGPHPPDPADFRDPQGRLKRQAARFRLYAISHDGTVLREITAADASITWTVHLANKKAAWFACDMAFDIPAAQAAGEDGSVFSCGLRNAEVTTNRAALTIDPGPRSISGINANADSADQSCAFDTGRFMDHEVYLGELQTDGQGRLIVLGGRGISGSPAGKPLTTYSNNDGWYDDVADGPVEATVTIGNRRYAAEGAWVVVGLPNYAPGITSIVTGYDAALMAGAALDIGIMAERPAFSRHIYPLLARFVQHQWVNAGFARMWGWGTPLDFTRPAEVVRLNDPGSAARPLRRAIFAAFRNPEFLQMEAEAWPPIYGDNAQVQFQSRDPREWLAVTPLQYSWLRRWADGDFDADGPPQFKHWDDLTAVEQVSGITRAVLDQVAAGPFYPGCEVSWVLRHPRLYASPFRIKRRVGEEPDFGPTLTAEIALRAEGPLDGSGPGDLTRWMGVPWQSDAASCQAAYVPLVGEYLPSVWPARIPNDVITAETYAAIIDPAGSQATREAAFAPSRREKWLRGIVYVDPPPPGPIRTSFPNEQVLTTMMTEWSRIGIVTAKPGPANDSQFPAEMWVETGRTARELPPPEPRLSTKSSPPPHPSDPPSR